MILKGALLLRADGEVLERPALRLRDGEIVEVETGDGLLRDHPGEAVEDWGDVLLMPGFVNGHAHSFQSLLRGIGDDLDFFSWRDNVLYRSAEWLTREDLETGALWSFAEMLRNGVTTVAEFFYVNDQGNENAISVIEAGRRLGIRMHFGRALYTWEQAPRRYRETPRDALGLLDALHRRYLDDPIVVVAPAPHSLHAADEEALAAGAEWALRHDTVCPIHVAEGAYEVRALRDRTGLGPAAFLDRLGALGPHSALVHGVHLDEADLRLISERQGKIVHNPSANAFLGDGIAPLVEMRRHGIRTCLGTDGGCTNNRLSLLDEMRLAVLLQRALHAHGGLLDAGTPFRMATVEGGRVFRLPVGDLAPGLRADIIGLSLEDYALLGTANLVAAVVYAVSQGAVRHAMVEGRTVLRDGKVLSMDQEELRRRVRAVFEKATSGRSAFPGSNAGAG